MNRLSLPTLLVAALVVAILLVFMFTFQVSFHEQAIKVRFGRADEGSIVKEPGLRFRWPWPVEQIYKYDTRLLTLDAPESEVKTQDGKNLIVGTYAIWRIDDPLKFFNRAKTITGAEDQMRPRLAQAQSAVMGRKSLDQFFNLDRAVVDQNHDQFVAEMKSSVQPLLLEHYGIALEAIGVRRISVPASVTQEIFKSMVQDRRRLAAEFREGGKSRAEAIRARAESDAKQILAFVERKAGEIRSAGIQASTRILAQIEETDREFFEWLRWLDTLKASLKQRTTIFIDKDWPLFQTFVQPPGAPMATPSSSHGPTE